MICTSFMGLSSWRDKIPLWKRALEQREREAREQAREMARKKKISPGWVAGIGPKEKLPEGKQEWYQPWMTNPDLLPKKPPGKSRELDSKS